MPVFFFFFLLLLCSSSSSAAAAITINSCCDIPLGNYFCPHCYSSSSSSCFPRSSEDFVARLNESLQQQFFGQEHLLQPLLEMFAHHAAQEPPALTAFHLAGDNGCGKSHLARLLGETLFAEGTSSPGFLVLAGENFMGRDVEVVRQHQRTLTQLIARTIEQCPRALIILDDVQFIHASTLLVLLPFMDEGSEYVVAPGSGSKVYKNKAMIGLVSDFGAEGITDGSDKDALDAIVDRHLSELWDLDPKQAHLIRYTFPFISLSDEALMHIAEARILAYRGEGSYTICAVAQELLAHLVERSHALYPHENGRGITKYLDAHFWPSLRDAMTEASAAAARSSSSFHYFYYYTPHASLAWDPTHQTFYLSLDEEDP